MSITVRRPAWKDRIIRAARTQDEDGLVKELDKVEEMLGDVISDEATVGGSDPHHIVVNVHGSSAPATMAHEAPAQDTPPASEHPAAVKPEVGGGEMADVLARLERVEQAIAILVQAEEGEVGEGDEGEEGEEGYFGQSEGEGKSSAGSGSGKGGGETEEEPGDPEESTDRHMRDGRRRTRDDEEEIDETEKWTKAKSGVTAAEDRRASVGDSSSLRLEFTETMARAELLVPGTSLMTFDAKSSAKKTSIGLCNFRRSILRQAWKSQDGQQAIKSVAAGMRIQGDFSEKSMTCDVATIVFNAASELRRASNNKTVTRSPVAAKIGIGHGLQGDLHSMNERNKQYYKVQ